MKSSKPADINLSDKARNLKSGYYEHYKGGRYKVLGVALHSETLEEMVIYQAQYGEKLVWVRPIDMFLGEKVLDDGENVPRFRFLKK